MYGVRRPCPNELSPQWLDGYPMTLPSPYRGRTVSDSTLQPAVSCVALTELWLGVHSLVGSLSPRCREGFKHGSASGPRACFRSHRPTPGRAPHLELSTYALLGAHPPLARAASLMLNLLSCCAEGCRGPVSRRRVCAAHPSADLRLALPALPAGGRVPVGRVRRTMESSRLHGSGCGFALPGSGGGRRRRGLRQHLRCTRGPSSPRSGRMSVVLGSDAKATAHSIRCADGSPYRAPGPGSFVVLGAKWGLAGLADAEHLDPAGRTDSPGRRTAVFQGDLLGVLHLPG